MVYTETDYQRERAIIDRAEAYWNANATFSRGGWSSLSAEKAQHPDYTACDNAMRGRVEQYEIWRDLPEKFGAYIASDGASVTTWKGDVLGRAVEVSRWRTPRSYVSSTMSQYRATVGGRTYTGRSGGTGMYIALRETAESKRRNPR